MQIVAAMLSTLLQADVVSAILPTVRLMRLSAVCARHGSAVTALREWYRVLQTGRASVLVEDAADTAHISRTIDSLALWRHALMANCIQELAVQNSADTPAVQIDEPNYPRRFPIFCRRSVGRSITAAAWWLRFQNAATLPPGSSLRTRGAVVGDGLFNHRTAVSYKPRVNR